MIPCQRALFDIPRKVCYLNCAYMSPLMHKVVEAGRRGVGVKARPWEISPPDFFGLPERARQLFAGVIGGEAEGVALIPSASYGLAVAAANLRPGPGQTILLIEDQFPCNVHVWRRLAASTGAETVVISRPEDGDLTRAVLEAIDERTAMLAAAQCRWTDGALVDLERVSPRLKQVGAALVLDLTQSAGALSFDAARLDPDFVIAATYKWLLGPYSMGFLYLAPRHREGRPIEETWMGREGAEDFARLVEYREGYRLGARRFDVGEHANFALLPAVIAALEQIAEWGVGRIEATLTARNAAIAREAERLGLRVSDPVLRAGHFLGLGFPGAVPRDLPERLAGQNVFVSLRGSSLRVTPHLYNDDEDVERLFEVLGTVL